MSKEKMEVVMTLWKVVEIDEDDDKANEQWRALHSQMLEVVRNCPELSDWDWDMQWDSVAEWLEQAAEDVRDNDGKPHVRIKYDEEIAFDKCPNELDYMEGEFLKIYVEDIRKGGEKLRELFDKDKVDALSTKEV
jgi:hypothetical protein